MSLHPCPSCRRHVAEVERVCPFCGAAVALASTPTVPSRLTRAAIFASTALAVPACWKGSTAPRETPIDHGRDREQQGTGSGSELANEVPPPAAGTGTIIVSVVDSNTGNAVTGRWVRLLGTASPSNQQVSTDASGNATFANVPPGTYQVQWHDGHPRHSPTTITVVVKPDETTQETMSVYIQPYNPNQQPMPYGAPPARRRVV